jgi:hypothetical protein
MTSPNQPKSKRGRRKKADAVVEPVAVTKPGKPTIDELMAILNSEEHRDVQILPNGSIVVGEPGTAEAKALTFRENLGGEYAA